MSFSRAKFRLGSQMRHRGLMGKEPLPDVNEREGVCPGVTVYHNR
jgi:hypothetical protein